MKNNIRHKIRMTVSLVVIMFELTGSLEFIVPTMAAVMFAKWVGDAIYRLGIYDAHIELNGYPFLDNKGEYPYSTNASQVMRPSSEMRVIEQNGMTVGELEGLLRETNCNGFPVVNDSQEMLVVGFCTRMDLIAVLRSARKTQPYVTTNSVVYFSTDASSYTTPQLSTNQANYVQSPNYIEQQQMQPGTPAVLQLGFIMDVAPMTVADQTPMETVIDMFRKLGLRTTLVTKNGKLLGIITKKDILTFMREGEH